MIIGVILSNFKCYKGLHYIPLTNANGSNYCGLIGLNGVGKSAVLEALDCILNGKKIIKTIDSDDNSYVIPIAAESKNIFENRKFKTRPKEIEKAQHCSDAIISFLNQNLSTKVSEEHLNVWKEIQKHCNGIETFLDGKLLIPLYPDNGYRLPSTGLFDDLWNETISICKRDLILTGMLLADTYIYVYVPQNFATDNLVFFETEQLQRLLDVNLYQIMDILNNDIVLKYRSKYKENITLLSKQLQEYRIIDSSNDDDFNVWDLFNYISHKVFPQYRLEKKTKTGNIPLSRTSSGEKQQAILDIIYLIVKEQIKDRLIIAIDEPETSFHLSERFEQFNKLYNISKYCGQVLFASHWYGFIPSIPDGCVVNIVKQDDARSCAVLDIFKYKEEIPRLKMPIDISLKGNSDLIQSIVSSVLIEKSYSWLICEGTSDKIYLEEYLKDEIEDKKIRIVPTGGCSHIVKIYNYLALTLPELKNDIKGKIYLLVDTDGDVKYEDPELRIKDKNIEKFFSIKRLVNLKKKNDTLLIDYGSTNNYPTDIEGVLNGKAFNKVILNNFKGELPFVTEDEKPEIPSAFALDLKDSEKDALKVFFTPQNKVRFARAYVEEIQKGGYKEPSWITEIKKFFQAEY